MPLNKILYIHQYFKTPQVGGAIRSYFIATALVKRGFQVELITAHHAKKYTINEIEGVHVHYLSVAYSNDMSAWRRYWAFIQFAYCAIRLSAGMPRPELAYVSSTPLTVGIIALWLRRFRNIPYIFEVRDLWPEAPIQLGVMRSIVIRRMAEWLEKASYKNAIDIVALSPGIQEGILLKAENVKVSVIPNMSDVDFYEQKVQKNHANHPLTIGYFGAMGMANGLKSIIDIAEVCQNRNLSVRFILMGEGSESTNLEADIKHKNLRNISLLPAADKFVIRQKMWDVDACLISFLKFPVLETCSPNKFFDALAGGKLCIVNADGWLRSLVEDYKCGFYFDPNYPEGFPTLIEPYLRNHDLLARHQKNALLLAKSHFSRELLESRVCALITKASQGDQ